MARLPAKSISSCYNPPVVNRQLGIRRSYIHETRRLALELIARGQQTLVFANNRLATEILVTYLKDACTIAARCRTAAFAAIAAAICRVNGARSNANCATAKFAAWWRPTRSNWASTSARSMPW